MFLDSFNNIIKVALVRGRYLNNFEGQNYCFDKNKIKLTAICSLNPINHSYPFPVKKLPSLADLQDCLFLNKPVKYLSNRIIGDSQILFGLEKLADQFEIFNTADSHYYYSYQLARMRKDNRIKHLISTSWETIPFNNQSTKQKKFIKKFAQQYTDFFICYTERAKNCLIREGITENKIKVVRLGVDLKRFTTQKYNSRVKSLTILYVGRLVTEKGLPDLQKAINKINNPLVKLKVVSNDSFDYNLMPEIYNKADIFVHPSKTTQTWEEQYGMVLIEAMASGLPIVAYDSGAVAEVINQAGILVKEGEINKLSYVINQLIENQDLRLKLGRISRDRAEKYFDSQKTVRQLTKLYENISRSSHKK